MNRRECVTLLGGAATWPFAARAQQPQRIRRVGVLMSTAEDDPQGQSVVAGVLKGLAQLGWVLGHNMQVDYRWAADDQVRGKTYAAEIVGLKPDVILISGSLPLQLLQQLTQSIPIVFTNINDPVGSGFVTGLARPGANITGFTPGDVSMYEKYPELLKQVAPAISRMAVLFKPDQSPQTGMLHTIEAVAPSMGLAITGAGVRSREDIERAIESLAREQGAGLIVLGNPVTTVNRNLIVALAARHRLPAIYPYRYFVTEGGLMSYDANRADMPQRTAAYVDRILRGEKPSDLPVQNPTRYEMVINLKTAKTMDLEVPLALLTRADEVIE